MAFLPKRKKDAWVARHTAQRRWTDKGLPRLGHLPSSDGPLPAGPGLVPGWNGDWAQIALDSGAVASQ